MQFLTSRILLVDLLTDRVPVKNIAGILIYRAHQYVPSGSPLQLLHLSTLIFSGFCRRSKNPSYCDYIANENREVSSRSTAAIFLLSYDTELNNF